MSSFRLYVVEASRHCRHWVRRRRDTAVVEPAVHHLEQLADEDETKEDAHGNEAIAFMDAQMVVVGFNYGVGRGGEGRGVKRSHLV